MYVRVRSGYLYIQTGEYTRKPSVKHSQFHIGQGPHIREKNSIGQDYDKLGQIWLNFSSWQAPQRAWSLDFRLSSVPQRPTNSAVNISSWKAPPSLDRVEYSICGIAYRFIVRLDYSNSRKIRCSFYKYLFATCKQMSSACNLSKQRTKQL